MAHLAPILRKYNTSTVILFTLVDATGSNFLSSAPTFASGDTQLSKDEGIFANTTNNPAHEGNGMYSLTLTATEMQAARISVTIVDQTATQVWLDEALSIDTYGNASAQHAFDLDTASVAQTGDNYARLGAPAGASVSADIAVIEAQTDDIGVAGAGLTDLGGMSTAMKAEVNTEADTALTDYDPPTRTEATSDKNEIITDLDDVKGTGFVKDTHSLVDIEAYVDILDDGTSGNVKIATDVAAVLVDTGTTLDGKINTIDTNVDQIETTVITNATGVDIAADIIALKAETSLIVADTNELQTDWADAGRLDVILDARASQTTVDAIETDTQDIQARIPVALVSGLMSSDMTAVSTSTAAADNMEAAALVIIIGAAETGTLSTTQMTSNLSETTDDHFINRSVIWTSGVLIGQASNITDYLGSTGMLTYDTVTEAPSNTDTFIIV